MASSGEIAAFVLYFIAVLLIGIIMFLRSKSGGEKEYFLGNRQMGSWVTAMSACASDMSAWLLMGLPGSILAFGLGKAWIGIGLAIGTACNWLLVAKRLRRFSQAANDSITIPQYLRNRFMSEKRSLQIICALIFLICFTVYVASAFVAGASVFTAVFPSLSSNTAMLIFAAILIVYTFLGGFKAVCWTDFIQGMLMFAALLAVPLVIAFTCKPDMSRLGDVFTGADSTVYAFTADLFSSDPRDIASGLAWGLGYFGMPHIIVRFMSIKKSEMVKKSSVISIIWVTITLCAVIVVACFGRILIGEELLAAGEQKLVFIKLARMAFPPFIAGLVLSAIIAASMSTADSQLLVASSSFTSDIYKPVFRKNASDKEIMLVGRAVIIGVAVIAYLIASSKAEGAQTIMELVENAWAGFGAAFGPVIILSLFWKKFTYKGAVAGIVSGAAADLLWLIFLSESTGIYELLPAFIIGLVAAVIATLLDSRQNRERAARIFETLKSSHEE